MEGIQFRRHYSRRVLLQMLVFGIVGPIFLIMYFASQPDPTVRWAYWIGLFITTADVLIALGLTASAQANRESRIAVKVLERRRGD